MVDEWGGLGGAGSSGGGVDIWGDLWGLAKERLRGEIQARNAEGAFGQDARYAVDENGNAYLRGQASTLSGAIGGLNPLAVIATIAVAAGMLYFALKE